MPSIRINLIFVALLEKIKVKVSFKSNKIIMTKNNVFVGRDIVIKVMVILY